MSKSFFIVFAWILLFTQVWAAVQKITIYEKPGQQGNAITLQGKHPNLTEWKFFLNYAKSYCSIGIWNSFDAVNYKVESTDFEFITDVEKCNNGTFSAFNSARFAGPEDSSTPAISLYEGSAGGPLVAGREYMVTGFGGVNIPFVPQWAYSFGNSSWTLFSGNYFDGNSVCFTPNAYPSDVCTGYQDLSLNSSMIVQSVVKGCGTTEVENNINAFMRNLN